MKMPGLLRSIAASAVLASGGAFAVDYAVNAVDYIDPVSGARAGFTQLWGNNNNGKVVGLASLDGGVTTFAFVYDPALGAFARLPAPPFGAANDYAAISLNDSDVVTGSYFAGGVEQGFIENLGAYSFFSMPGWPSTEARTISNPTAAHPQGLVVGFASDPVTLGGATGTSIGFIHDPATGAFTTIPTPPSVITIAQGLNIAGQAVGSVRDPAGGTAALHGFLYTPTAGDPMLGGTVTTFQVAGFGTRARGINDHGLLAAAVNDVPGTGSTSLYIATASGPGAVGFQRIDVPSATGPVCPDGTTWPGVFPEGLNNAGQITGILTDAACVTHGFIATPAYVPNGTTAAGAYTFSVDVVPNVPVFIDPAVAIGYDYEIGKRDPRFASVRLPLGIGNNRYVLVVDGRAYDLNAGQLFDFTQHGFKQGVRAFRVACIDPSALLDPLNAAAFPTEVSFASAGRFTGTQMPLTSIRDHGGVDPTMSQAECRDRLMRAARAPGPPAL